MSSSGPRLSVRVYRCATPWRVEGAAAPRTAAHRIWRRRCRPGSQDVKLVDALHPERLSRSFNEHQWSAVRRYGLALPEIRLHDLRHTHATLLLTAGVHPKIVSERLGHANVSITLDVYSHAVRTLQREAASQVTDLIFGPS